YDKSEAILRTLLSEAGSQQLPAAGIHSASAAGGEAAADLANVQSPETYVGYARAENFSSPSGFMPDQANLYQVPARLDLNQWALKGTWTVEDEKATLDRTPGGIVYRFHARDLHLVLGPGATNKPVRFRVRLDGADPGSSHGVDTDASGNG